MKKRISDRLGIENLNEMQEATLNLKVPARILLLAPTGSGKTLAFALPFLHSLPRPGHGLRGLVIAPTRELVLQTAEVLRVLAAPERKTVALYGGHRVNEETASLAGNPDIAVATPGRLLDHIRRNHINVHDVCSLVLDEYDKSLELGFHEEMRAIVGRLKHLDTTILTSATSGAELPDFIRPEGFDVLDFTSAGQPKVEILKVKSEAADKIDTLDVLMRSLQPHKTIVFVNHRESADRTYDILSRSIMEVWNSRCVNSRLLCSKTDRLLFWSLQISRPEVSTSTAWMLSSIITCLRHRRTGRIVMAVQPVWELKAVCLSLYLMQIKYRNILLLRVSSIQRAVSVYL